MVNLYRKGRGGHGNVYSATRINGKTSEPLNKRKITELSDKVLDAFNQLPKHVKRAMGIK